MYELKSSSLGEGDQGSSGWVKNSINTGKKKPANEGGRANTERLEPRLSVWSVGGVRRIARGAVALARRSIGMKYWVVTCRCTGACYDRLTVKKRKKSRLRELIKI